MKFAFSTSKAFWILPLLTFIIAACSPGSNIKSVRSYASGGTQPAEVEEPSEDLIPADEAPIPFRLASALLETLDPLATGTFQTYETLEYKTPPEADTTIMPNGAMTDLTAVAYLPVSSNPATKFPLIIIFTGNHATCGVVPANPANPRVDGLSDYTTTGACPTGSVEAPSYKGYEYLAKALTSWGFAVISVSPNRGINGPVQGFPNDPALIRARAALLRKHITYLKTVFPRAATLDFQQLGLIGHSRGGDTARTFYNVYKEPAEFQVRAIYELAPLDFGSGQAQDPVGIPWGVMLAACDGDLSSFPGIDPFRRMIKNRNGTSKTSIVTVTGANHNFFNTEWQTSDARICEGSQTELWDYKAPVSPEGETLNFPAQAGVKGSADQLKIGQAFITTFFRANLGANKRDALNRVFDPRYLLPKMLGEIRPVQREYLNFEAIEFYSMGTLDGTVGVEYAERGARTPDIVLRDLAEIIWQKPSANNWFQTEIWKEGKDVSGYSSLNLNMSRRELCSESLIQEDCLVANAVDFTIQLVDVDDQISKPIKATRFLNINNTVNRDIDGFANYVPLLFDGVNLPIQELKGKLQTDDGKLFQFDKLKGIRLVFDQSSGGKIFINRLVTLTKDPIEYPADQKPAVLTLEPAALVPVRNVKLPSGITAETWQLYRSRHRHIHR